MAERYISSDEFKAIIHKLNNYLFIVSGKLEIALQDESLGQKLEDTLKETCRQIEEIKEYIDHSVKVFLESPKQE